MKRKQVPLKKIKDGHFSRFNLRTHVLWEVIKKWKNKNTILIEANMSNQSREVDKNRLVYPEF